MKNTQDIVPFRGTQLEQLARSVSRGWHLGRLSVGTFAAAVLWSSFANAEILLAQTRTSSAVYGGSTYTVDFNGGLPGGTEFQFSTSAPNTRVVIIFNAECAVDGATTRWIDIDIGVDPAGLVGWTNISPSNGDNALCSGNGTTTTGSGNLTLDGWVSAATVATVVLPQAGAHKVRVRVNGAHAGIARLDDMSLVVMR